MNVRLPGILLLAVVISTVGCRGMVRPHNLPPSQLLLEPGPGVGGPGPGVIPPAGISTVGYGSAAGMVQGGPYDDCPPGEMGYGGGPYGPPVMAVGAEVPAPPVQLLFAKPEGMQVRWDIAALGAFDSTPLFVPGRKNFPQGGIYRLKLTNIAGRDGIELYPTVELAPTTPRSAAYLFHNAIPIQFTEEDFDQVLSGNFVTKVIYLPDPEFQELALAGVETLVSNRLDPGMDPITEADRRGAILAIIRLGNKDMEMPGANPAVGGGVLPIGYQQQAGPDAGAASAGPQTMPVGYRGQPPYPVDGIPSTVGAGGLVPPYVAGVSAPHWGMPISGTPIGLPGPPHVPLGIPAGLQKHTMKNRTHVRMPQPVEHVHINMKQRPGYSYPQPPSRAIIRENVRHAPLKFRQPAGDKHHIVGGNEGCADCQ